MAYYSMRYKTSPVVTELLSLRTVSAGTSYTLAKSITNFDYIQILFCNSSSGKLGEYLQFYTAGITTASTADFIKGIHYTTSTIYSSYTAGFTSNTAFKVSAVSNSNSSYPLYVQINGIKFI